uniref:Uncharacterized protein n=1 Tax=Ixodes ricinus TaxID=34613 RepID=A0A6B0V1K3_IXORI
MDSRSRRLCSGCCGFLQWRASATSPTRWIAVLRAWLPSSSAWGPCTRRLQTWLWLRSPTSTRWALPQPLGSSQSKDCCVLLQGPGCLWLRLSATWSSPGFLRFKMSSAAATGCGLPSFPGKGPPSTRLAKPCAPPCLPWALLSMEERTPSAWRPVSARTPSRLPELSWCLPMRPAPTSLRQ